MKKIYAPGCGLMIYKPILAEKAMEYLNQTENTSLKKHMICCRHAANNENLMIGYLIPENAA